MLLLIDNYDSFVFNLQRYLTQLGQQVRVLRNDDPQLLEDLAAVYSAIVISPGPKTPRDAGHCLHVARNWSGQLPILGICLGHQVIFEAFGGTIVRAAKPVHGKSSIMHLLTSRLFEGIPSQSRFARYHSLIGAADTLPDWLKVIAWSLEEQEIMAVEHREHPTFGVQFHPESILSLHGHLLLRNFLHVAGLPDVGPLPKADLCDPEQANWQASSDIEMSSQPVVLPWSPSSQDRN